MPDTRPGVARSGSTLGAIVSQKRRAAGLTQAQLAAQVGATTRTIARWETEGASRPTIATVLRVAAVLDIPTDEALAALAAPTKAA